MEPFTFNILFKKSDFLLFKKGNIWCREEYKSKILYSDLIPSEFYTSKILFIYGCSPLEWIPFLKEVSSTLKLVILGGNDIPILNANIQSLLEILPTTQLWITNWLGNHPQCTLLPIFPSHAVDYYTFESKKKNLFGIPFVRLNSSARKEFLFSIEKLPELYPYLMRELPNEKYQEALQSLYFCCCPMGNGFDTHRFWESLYFGAIPIVKSHTFYDILVYHYPNIPMILIEEWEDLPNCVKTLSIEKYEELWKSANLEILQKEYWNTKLVSILNESSGQ